MKAEPQAKLLFALTSPSLCNVQGDGSVVTLNNQAAAIMAKYNVSGVSVQTDCGLDLQLFALAYIRSNYASDTDDQLARRHREAVRASISGLSMLGAQGLLLPALWRWEGGAGL